MSWLRAGEQGHARTDLPRRRAFTRSPSVRVGVELTQLSHSALMAPSPRLPPALGRGTLLAPLRSCPVELGLCPAAAAAPPGGHHHLPSHRRPLAAAAASLLLLLARSQCTTCVHPARTRSAGANSSSSAPSLPSVARRRSLCDSTLTGRHGRGQQRLDHANTNASGFGRAGSRSRLASMRRARAWISQLRHADAETRPTWGRGRTIKTIRVVVPQRDLAVLPEDQQRLLAAVQIALRRRSVLLGRCFAQHTFSHVLEAPRVRDGDHVRDALLVHPREDKPKRQQRLGHGHPAQLRQGSSAGRSAHSKPSQAMLQAAALTSSTETQPAGTPPTSPSPARTGGKGGSISTAWYTFCGTSRFHASPRRSPRTTTQPTGSSPGGAAVFSATASSLSGTMRAPQERGSGAAGSPSPPAGEDRAPHAALDGERGGVALGASSGTVAAGRRGRTRGSPSRAARRAHRRPAAAARPSSSRTRCRRRRSSPSRRCRDCPPPCPGRP